MTGKSIDLKKLLQQQLCSLAQHGVHELPKGSGERLVEFAEPAEANVAQPSEAKSIDIGRKNALPAAPKAPPSPAPPRNFPQNEPWSNPLEASQKPAALELINAEVRQCVACEELCEKRTQTVFGVGDPSARLVFVGEGPGADEDRLGEPFVGAAGKLLNRILGASKLTRDEVYILNTVKCRPPRNRNPSETELGNCWSFAQRQLETIQPEFICCLGSVAAKTMLQTTQSLGRLRGRFHPWGGARLIVTYHPAYLLRNEGAKRHVWEDMKMLVKEMGIDLSK